MIRPDGNRAGGDGTRPMIAMADTDLPEPDSPTMPSVSPGLTDQLTPSTARTTPLSVWKCTRRSSTDSNGSAFVAGAAGGGSTLVRSASAVSSPSHAGWRSWPAYRSFGSRASRRPSPTKTKASTVKTTAAPGSSDSHGWV